MIDVISITVQAEGEGPPTEIRVRRFLKALLRQHGLKCIDVSAGPMRHQTHAEQRPDADVPPHVPPR